MLILNYTLVFIDLCVHMTFSHLQFGGKKKEHRISLPQSSLISETKFHLTTNLPPNQL